MRELTPAQIATVFNNAATTPMDGTRLWERICQRLHYTDGFSPPTEQAARAQVCRTRLVKKTSYNKGVH